MFNVPNFWKIGGKILKILPSFRSIYSDPIFLPYSDSKPVHKNILQGKSRQWVSMSVHHRSKITNSAKYKVSNQHKSLECNLQIVFTWYKRNHRSNHLLLSEHRLCKNPASLESYRAFSASPKSWPSLIRIDLCIRWTFGLNIKADIFAFYTKISDLYRVPTFNLKYRQK